MTAPTVTIALPVYNAAPFLRECIDSILCQDFRDFELLAADDGSTDCSVDILRSYADHRLRVLACPHNYIGTLNRLLDEARGRYVARMDADDVMLPGRLRRQVEYLEAHPETGVLGGAMEVFGAATGTSRSLERVAFEDMLCGCCMAHPTVMMRRSVLDKHKFRYEPAFVYAEDYRLWLRMLQAGVVFRNLPEPLIRYRVSDQQVTHLKGNVQHEHAEQARREAAAWLDRTVAAVCAERPPIPESRNLLTVVIPFLNEGEEVAATVRSIRQTAGAEVDIIVVNDASDDGYDYETELKDLHLTYVKNRFRIGAAAAKEKGVQLVKTPYFLLLDAHMRFYDSRWPRRIVATLQADDRQLLCSQTLPLEKRDGEVVKNNQMAVRGAFATFCRDEYMPGIRWNPWGANRLLQNNEVPCVLGAGYAASTRYWNRLGGLQGLRHYGCEETFISIKAWMEGGRCRLMPDVVIGHIYRPAPPYRIVNAAMRYNYFVNSEVLFPTSLRCWAHAVGCRADRQTYALIRRQLDRDRARLDGLRRRVQESAQRDFSFILDINDIITPEKAATARERKKMLPRLMDFICPKGTPDGIALWDGPTAGLLAAAAFAGYTGDEAWNERAGRLLDTVCHNLHTEQPVSLAHGVCGTGWGLLFLMGRGWLGDDAADELCLIDRLVQERSPRRTADITLRTGLGGILCYVVARLGRLRAESKTADTFADDYLEELADAARRVLQESDDYRCHSFALQFLARHDADWTILPPTLEDVVDPPAFLPEDPRFWRRGLDAADGYALHLITTLTNIKERGYGLHV